MNGQLSSDYPQKNDRLLEPVIVLNEIGNIVLPEIDRYHLVRRVKGSFCLNHAVIEIFQMLA